MPKNTPSRTVTLGGKEVELRYSENKFRAYLSRCGVKATQLRFEDGEPRNEWTGWCAIWAVARTANRKLFEEPDDIIEVASLDEYTLAMNAVSELLQEGANTEGNESGSLSGAISVSSSA